MVENPYKHIVINLLAISHSPNYTYWTDVDYC